MLRILETIDPVSRRAERKEDRESLQRHANFVLAEVNRSSHQKRDKETVQKLYEVVSANIRGHAEPEDRGAAPPSDRG